ncbi:MAG: pyridoxamine 5'-phosphate oxidase family protein [Actinobacteria bacterium]|nr:pyridoxamine 5'-phosphate oxidase family protein [Actinomycetota bacterium]
MSDRFHQGQRALQDRFDTRRLADKLASAASDTFAEPFHRFIEARDMFFIATTDSNGAPDCSYKGGDPGFVRVIDDRTLAFPVYDGNGMFLTVGNLTVNPQIGMLFIDFETGTRLRVNGEATVALDDPLVSTYPGAIGVVRVRATAIFANCRRYVHEYRKVSASPFVPHDAADAPVPDWKRDPWFDGTLPAGDPALDPDRPSAPAIPQF